MALSLYERWQRANTPYLSNYSEQYLPVYGGGEGQRSGVMSSSGIGGATRQDIEASPEYNQFLTNEADSQQIATDAWVNSYIAAMQRAGVQPDERVIGDYISKAYTPKGLVFGGKASTIADKHEREAVQEYNTAAAKQSLELLPLAKEERETEMAEKKSMIEWRKARVESMKQKDSLGWSNLALKMQAQTMRQQGRLDEAERLAALDDAIKEAGIEKDSQAITYIMRWRGSVADGSISPAALVEASKSESSRLAGIQEGREAKDKAAESRAEEQAMLRRDADVAKRETDVFKLRETLVAIDDAISKMGSADTVEYGGQTYTRGLLEGRKALIEQRIAELGPKQSASSPRITTQAEYDKLPSGTVFIDASDGKTYRKP